MKEKSIHQFNVKFIFTVLKACYVLKMTVIKATTIRPPKYLGSILIQGVRAARGVGGGPSVSLWEWMDSLRRFGLRVSTPQAFLCGFSSCLEYLVFLAVQGAKSMGAQFCMCWGLTESQAMESGQETSLKPNR